MASDEVSSTFSKSKSAPSPPDPNKPVGYEFLDHTADVQIHSWAPDLKQAIEQAILAMYDYLTEIDTVEIDPDIESLDVNVEGHDLESLLYAVMDEFLFQFSTEFFLCKKVEILELNLPPATSTDEGEGDQPSTCSIHAKGYGEKFTKGKHPPGTEIKAITYSNMQINRSPDGKRVDIFVIVDI